MKKSVAMASLAAALCLPFAASAQSSFDEQPGLLAESFQVAALQDDDILMILAPQEESSQIVAEAPQPAPQGPEAAPQPGPQQPPCPMMNRSEGFQRHMGFMGRPGQFGHGQQMGQPGQGMGDLRARLDAKMAVEAPAQFAEIQKLRAQEMKIVKDFVEKAKADREEFKKLLDSYKANPTDDVKAQIRAKIAAREDALLKAKEARLSEMSQKLEDAKKGKDAAVDAALDRVLKGGCPMMKDAKPGTGPGCCPMMKDAKPGCPMSDKDGKLPPPPPNA